MDRVVKPFPRKVAVVDPEDAVASFKQDDASFRRLADNAAHSMMRLNRAMLHVYVNQAATRMFGVSAESFLGKTPLEIGLAPPVAAAYANASVQVFRSGQARSFTFQLESDGGVRHFSARLQPEAGSDGSIETLLATCCDVTQYVQARLDCEALLLKEQSLRSQAEEGVRARDQFLSILSHELRSPLNGIQSWAHVLEHRVGSDPAPPITRALTGIKTGVQQQVRMINALVDTMHVLTGKLGFERQMFELNPVIRSVVEQVGELAQERKIALHVEYPAAEMQLFGNAERVAQLVEHLLVNGVKFNQPGGWVKMSVSLSDGEVIISVADNGKGIAPSLLPLVFEPFQLAAGAGGPRGEGLGLGLTLVRHLSELHGGRVTAYSAGEGEGARFTVYLPLNEVPAVN